jgi:vanillate O-demethylase monooxygenase subunit
MKEDAASIQPNVGTGHHAYPRNGWWVAAMADEVTREPLGRWLLERPVLLYRTRDGKAVALDNRCPHRWAPLSDGKIVDDDVQCPYHGIRFRPDGSCAAIPSQKAVPSGCAVTSYPVRERHPFVWIWMGDPERIDEYNPPADTSWTEDAEASHVGGYMEVAGNYMWLHENVLDLTHFEHVHADTIVLGDKIVPPKVTTTETQVIYTQDIPNRLLPSYLTRWTELPGDKPCDFKGRGAFESPAFHHNTETIHDHAPEPDRPSNYVYHIMHATTPIDRHRFHYWWVSGANIPVSDEVKERWASAVPIVFGQDKKIIESIEEMLTRDGRGTDYPEVMIRADLAGMHARQKLRMLLARE